jgi:AcrR family transcriptional regulator
MSNQAKSRRERRFAQRRAQILNAATIVFAEKGFHNTTIREIADEADLADGTIYNYFKNKDDLLIGILGQLGDLQERRQMMDNLADQRLEDAVFEIILHRLKAMEHAQPLLLAILPQIYVDHELRKVYQQQIIQPLIRAISEYLHPRLAPDKEQSAEVEMKTHLVVALMHGIQTMLILDDAFLVNSLHQPEAFAGQLAAFISRGLGA